MTTPCINGAATTTTWIQHDHPATCVDNVTTHATCIDGATTTTTTWTMMMMTTQSPASIDYLEFYVYVLP